MPSGAERRAVLAALLLAAGLGACGGPSGPGITTAGRTPATGYYVGHGEDVGAAVDFRGDDATAAAVRRALATGSGGAVAIASVVNDGARAAPVPRFTAERRDGGRVALMSARRVLAGRADPAGRRALARLPRGRRAISVGGSALIYLVLRDAAPREIGAVVMRPVAGDPVELRERAR